MTLLLGQNDKTERLAIAKPKDWLNYAIYKIDMSFFWGGRAIEQPSQRELQSF